VKGLFADKEVNTGRQVEFDYSKGLFLFAILFIHAFQVAGRDAGMNDEAYKIIYMILSMTGAPIFMFVMGLGTRYRSATPLEMVHTGGRLLFYQYLSNVAWVASIMLPYFILRMFTDISAATEEVRFLSDVFIIYINIFFLAGGIYLVLALCCKLKTPVWFYVVLGLVINIFSPKLIGLNTGFASIDYILGGIFGGTPYASFSVLNYLPYTFFGIAFGELLKRVTDKKRFYAFVFLFSTVILTVFVVWVFSNHRDFNSLYQYMGRTYTEPDFMRTLANTSAVAMTAGVLFFLSNIIAKLGFLHRLLLYYSKHISKYYAVHMTFFFLAFGFIGYKPVSFWGCVVLFVLSIFYCDAIVRFYNRLLVKQLKHGGNHIEIRN
jgi:hypothetical protein